MPRALLHLGLLDRLLTDAFVPPSSFLAKVCGSRSKLRDRFHNDLRDARVKAFNSSLIMFEALARARRLRGWARIVARNRWFQRNVVSYLDCQFSTINSPPIVLSYSYTALWPFRFAKSHAWKKVLVQVDPGPEEEKIVAQEAARERELTENWNPAPTEYWALWQEECKLADRIVVNSEWSREALIRGGVPNEKLSVVPLAYEMPAVRGQESQVRSARSFPARFTSERPMRVLFLGLINLRKGVARLLEAARMLRSEPIEFWMVGPAEIANVGAMADTGHVKWFGPVTRNQAAEFYKNADVFILPTLSDGFAITQLEAQAYGLPVISSPFCGKVVESGRNGIILEESTAACITAALRDCIANPNRLQKFAAASRVPDKFTMRALANRLQELDAIFSEATLR